MAQKVRCRRCRAVRVFRKPTAKAWLAVPVVSMSAFALGAIAGLFVDMRLGALGLFAGACGGTVGVILYRGLRSADPCAKCGSHWTLPAPSTKRCPACDESIRFAATKCRHCGEQVGE